MSEEPAVARYKNVIADLAAAADDLRDRDRARAAELGRQLVEHDDAMARAEQRGAVARFAADMAWEEALDALWQESWMTLRPRPAPDGTADPARLDELVVEVEQASAALTEAVRRRFWQL